MLGGGDRSQRLRRVASGLWLPQRVDSYASCADAAGLAIADDLDVRWFGVLELPITSGSMLMSQWGAAGNQSWSWDLTSTAIQRLQFSTTGSNSLTVNGGISLTGTNVLKPGDRLGLRMTMDRTNGTNKVVRYLISLDDGTTWTDYDGGTGTNLSALFNSTSPLVVGVRLGDGIRPMGGRTDRVEVRSGIDGTVVASPDFSAQPRGEVAFKDAQGNQWTLAGDARIAA